MSSSASRALNAAATYLDQVGGGFHLSGVFFVKFNLVEPSNDGVEGFRFSGVEGILIPKGMLTHTKEYAGTFEGILTHAKEYADTLPLSSYKKMLNIYFPNGQRHPNTRNAIVYWQLQQFLKISPVSGRFEGTCFHYCISIVDDSELARLNLEDNQPLLPRTTIGELFPGIPGKSDYTLVANGMMLCCGLICV